MSTFPVQVRLLGPVDVLVNGKPTALSGVRRNAIFAALALRIGEPVSAEWLIRTAWGNDAPGATLNTLQAHISFLRGVFGSAVPIVNGPNGYSLAVSPEATDVSQAESRIAAGKRTGDPAEAMGLLRSALSLWRGRSLSEVSELPWFREQAERLENLRLDAVQDLIEARMLMGETAALVSELESLVELHPYRENFSRQLMLALYHSGRQADALTAYRRLRDALANDLGIDPGVGLQDLEAAILRQDPSLDDGSIAGLAPSSVVPRVPSQLPSSLADFSGRDSELNELHEVLDAAQLDSGNTRVAVAVISGMAGVGKSALAVQWAHSVRERFPDGQLYANLRGFDPAGSPRESTEVLRAFLEALGMPPGRVPDNLDVQTGLFRSILAGRRVLVMLDNARDADQVRPLLPGTARSIVVVTSRNQLLGLSVVDGARLINLDIPAADKAEQMFASRVGHARCAAEPEVVREIVDMCARLPLALAIVAARANAHRKMSLATIAQQLRESGNTLDPFYAGDPSADVRAVLSWSYEVLKPEIAELFRRLGLAPGHDFGAGLAASLTGLAPRVARSMLVELARANMFVELAPDRFSFHDLVRAFALEQVETHETGDEVAAIQDRVWRYYVRNARAAALVLQPARLPIDIGDEGTPEVVSETISTRGSAMRWFEQELSAMKAIIAQGGSTNRRSWQLSWAVLSFLELRGAWEENARLQSTALAIATRQNDRIGQAYTSRNLGGIFGLLGRFDEARRYAQQAAKLLAELGEDVPAVIAQINIAWIALRQERFDEGITKCRFVASACAEIGQLSGQGQAETIWAWCEVGLGHLNEALDHAQRGVELFGDCDDVAGLAEALECLGYVIGQLGDVYTAIDYLSRAAALHREVGDLHSEASAQDRLGECYHKAGNYEQAAAAWRQTLAIYDEVGFQGTTEIVAKLAALHAGGLL